MLPPIEVREYGEPGATLLVLLHGGPGAPGYMAPLARALAARGYHVLEPLQRSSAPDLILTVDRHVEDLQQILAPLNHPVILGSSWGAMLALAHAAKYPGVASALILVGSGTFSLASREEFSRRLEMRGGHEMRRALDALDEEAAREGLDPDEKLRRHVAIVDQAYSYDLISPELELLDIDGVGNKQAWQDMIALQERGVYPSAFERIDVPALLIHGDVDPHPGDWIHRELLPHVPQLEYIELERCGHYPWMERFAREAFLEQVERWTENH